MWDGCKGEKGQTCQIYTNSQFVPQRRSRVNTLTSQPQLYVLPQRATVKINDWHQDQLPEGKRGISGLPMCVHGSMVSYKTSFNIIHWQQVTVIKFSFICSRATTKVQKRIKRRRATLLLLMLRPFENLLAMRRVTMLQGRITQQRDGVIWNEVWEPPSASFISTSIFCSLRQNPSLVFASLMSVVCCF